MKDHKDVQGLNYGMVPWQGGSVIKKRAIIGNIFERVVRLLGLAVELNMVDESLILCDDLLNYNSQGDEFIVYPCQGCDENTEVHEIENFDPDMHYCGGSPSCCP